MEIHENVARAISRAIFSDNDLVIKSHPLGQNTLECLSNESLMVIGDHHHANLHTIAPMLNYCGASQLTAPHVKSLLWMLGMFQLTLNSHK